METTTYKVRAGDTLWAIGEKFSMPWEKIWNASENEEFKRARGNPNMLYPGDELVIPPRDAREESRGTEARHRFRKPGKARIRIAVLDLYHEPMSGVEYAFMRGDDTVDQGNTDGDGIAEMRLTGSALGVRLVLPWGEFPIEAGELDPANTVRGIQQRLTNLGIACGPIDGLCGPLTRRGIHSFQRIEKIDETGEPDEGLIKALRERHDGESIGAAEELEKHEPDRDDAAPEELSVADSGGDADYPDAVSYYGNNNLELSKNDDG